jgi:DNA-binding transcriptional LysR family regulator
MQALVLKATFRQLQIFIAVVEARSFAVAAANLGVTPAAISDQIRALEKRMVCELFERRPGTTPVLNERGEQLFQHATRLLESAGQAAAIANAELHTLHTARIAADEYIVERLLRPVLPTFQRAHPDTQIQFLQLNHAVDAVQALRTGRADLAYLTLWTLDVDWPIDIITTVGVGLYVSPAHPIVRTWSSDRRQKIPLITPIAGSGMEQVMSRSLKQAGITAFESVAHTQYGSTMAELAKDGVGVCYVMRDAVTQQVQSGELVELEAGLPNVYRCALRRAGGLDVPHLRTTDEFVVTQLRRRDA